jgi:hypothetical protein
MEGGGGERVAAVHGEIKEIKRMESCVWVYGKFGSIKFNRIRYASEERAHVPTP